MFIVVEGPIGVGKTTVMGILSERLGGFDKVLLTKQPSNGPIGNFIKELLKDPGYMALGRDVHQHLYYADRLWHIRNIIIPFISARGTVICDRYYHSGMVFSPEQVTFESSFYKDILKPDFTFILRANPATIIARQLKRGDTTVRKTTSEEDIKDQLNRYSQIYSEVNRRHRDGETPEICSMINANGEPNYVADAIMGVLEANNGNHTR